MDDEASNANLIFHSGEVELLREQIKGGMPDSPQPLDGQLYIPHEPIPANKIATETVASTNADSYFAPLEEAKQKAVELGKTLVCTQFGPTQHYFLVDDPELINQVTRIWSQQIQVIGHDVKFTIEAAVAYNAKSGEGNCCTLCDTLFDPATLPTGYHERATSDDNGTQLVISLPGLRDMDEARLIAICQEVEAWLGAYTFVTGVGMRVSAPVVVPVRRRFLVWEIGRQHRIMRPVSCEKLKPIASCALAKDDVRNALTGVRRALSALGQGLQAAAVELWTAMERTLDSKGRSLLTEEEKPQCEQFLLNLLGPTRGPTAYSVICDLRQPGRSPRIAGALHELLPELSLEQCLIATRKVAGVRGALTHEGTKKPIQPDHLRLIMHGLLRYVAHGCEVRLN